DPAWRLAPRQRGHRRRRQRRDRDGLHRAPPLPALTDGGPQRGGPASEFFRNRRCVMPKYLVQASISREGISNVLTKVKGSGVRDAVTKFAESAGGKIEAFYF